MDVEKALLLFKRLLRDEQGSALIFVTITLPVLVGFALLAIDMSRANSLHNDLQKAADAFALAGAAELDGSATAITRANHAIDVLVSNSSKFSTAGNQTLTSSDLWPPTYLKSLPADDVLLDKDGIGGNGVDYKAADAGEARFVLITARGSGFQSIFPASFLGGVNGFNVGAQAVAGFKRSICDVTPMFICNPFEASGISIQDAFAQGMTYSREFRLLKVDTNPGPGNFGLLRTDLPLDEAFAKGNSGQCYEQYAVTTKTGVTLGKVNTGLNVRLDIYSGNLKHNDNDPAYRPSVNVRKGADKNSNCNKFSSATDGSAMGFPAGTNGTYYTDQAGVSGDGWDRSGYWTLNHGTALPTIPSTTNPVSKTRPPSRYDVYKYEIANNEVGDHAGGKNNGETGIPACYKGGANTLTQTPDRRILIAAVVNCSANGTKIAGQTSLQPDGYVSAFVTNPIEKVDNSQSPDSSAAEKPIRLEIVDVAGSKGNGSLDNFLHDEVQLYR